MKTSICTLVLGLLLSSLGAVAGPLAEERHWQPVPDTVYLQEINGTVPTDAPVTVLALHGQTLYLVKEGTLHQLHGDRLVRVERAPLGIVRLQSLDGALWAATAKESHRFDGDTWTQIADFPLVDVCLHAGAVHVASRDDIYRFEEGKLLNIKPEEGYLSSDSTVLQEDGTQLLADPVRIGPIHRIGSYLGTLYMMRPGSLSLLEGTKHVPNPIDWGTMPSPNTHDMLILGSRMFLATDRGVGVLRGMALTVLTGKDGLPYEDTTCLAPGFDSDVWIGTTKGAVRYVGSEFHYFAADHWLPGDHVYDIAAGDHVVYVATDKGLGIIRYEPFTLQKKAAYFERDVEEGGFKRLGFLHKLYWHAGEQEFLREISDNDGGHTSHYLAAMSFKYAATGDEDARQKAVDAFNAMKWLQEITGTDGFFARAIWAEGVDKGRRSERGSGGLPAKWYPTEDGKWSWKGDTSSDEVNGHYYSVAIFHDLAAKGEEKERAKDHLARITRHIIDNGWVLRDMDGKPTRWGRWDPQYLLRPYGMIARGLNGMEAQGYVWTAYKLTGDEFFKQGIDQLVAWGYHNYTLRQKYTFPPDHMVPWDDELAFRTYHPLLTYADDPYLRGIYLRSLARHWEVLRLSKLPYFNFIYGAMTGNDCEAEQAVQHLREWSLDLVNHRYENWHRADLHPEPGYTQYGLGPRAISPRNQEAMWGSRPATRLDGGSGTGVTPPIGWLEDYWMGRYYGFIEAPETTSATALVPEPRPRPLLSAKPYDGPARP